ncbi:MAG: single-stranded-DNA-specific exonuclease RecJ [Clostridiales bacterium]|nr:single-stranded-DNA-specific exonuclease RecJ [Clostridiales bacterium]
MENWVIKNIKADFKQIIEKCNVSEVLARCLVNRGLDDPDQINAFLHPSLDKLYDPFLLKDMEKACNLLVDKIRTGKSIRIIGDYDVDGVMSTYILYCTLKMIGADVDYDIPDRINDGYGINIRMVEDAREDNIDTLLTCDNGIVALDEIKKAKEYGMTVIVTDHHNLHETDGKTVVLPEADAIINPKQPNCIYPFSELCGGAIAYKLAIALLSRYEISGRTSYEEELITYAAIATVCDVMELIDENRIIVKHGLSLLKNSQNTGLVALMDLCQIDRERLSSFHLGFIIGPCLNASGRLDSAKRGIKLLLSETKSEALELATELRSLNEERKNMTAEYTEKAVKVIEEGDMLKDKVLVIYLSDCHESITGIIAGRIREKYNRPTIILTDSLDYVKGSGRSIDNYNMIEELNKHRELMLKVGGHPMAAGLSIWPDRIESLRNALNENPPITEEMLKPKVTIDILLPLGYLSEDLVNELKLLEPFGRGNEKPLFVERDLAIKSILVIGRNSNGIKLRVKNSYGREMDALYFGDVEGFFAYISDTYGDEEAERLKTGRGTNLKLTATYYPNINEYNGYKNLQLMIQNYR